MPSMARRKESQSSSGQPVGEQQEPAKKQVSTTEGNIASYLEALRSLSPEVIQPAFETVINSVFADKTLLQKDRLTQLTTLAQTGKALVQEAQEGYFATWIKRFDALQTMPSEGRPSDLSSMTTSSAKTAPRQA